MRGTWRPRWPVPASAGPSPRSPGPAPGATIVANAYGEGVNLVNLEKVVKEYGQRLLLNGVSAGVAAGERVGVVGRNGAGKSTLLALLAGVEQPLSGPGTSLVWDLQIGHLAQQDRLAGTVGALVTGGRPSRGGGDPRTRSAVAALLPGIDFAAQAERLSVVANPAGSRWPPCSWATPSCSCSTSRPTISTSEGSVGWRDLLAARRGALVVVTHDRWFLDADSADMGDRQGGVRAQEGGYAAYVWRARSARAGSRTPQGRRRQLATQGTGVAAARPPGADQQAAVPDRGGERADRRSAPPRNPLECCGSRWRGWG